MKQLRLFFTMLMLTLLGGNAWADEVTVSMTTFTEISGYVNDDVNISYAAAKGTSSTAPAIYDGVIRIYQNGGTFTVTANNGAKINSITLGSAMATTVTYSLDNSTEESENQSISANGALTINDLDCSSVLFTCKGTDKNSRLYVNNLSVTYVLDGPVILPVATPTFNPEAGSFTEAQDVEINTTTEGATIYYTTDGSTPTEESTEYTGAITIEETTTVKAIAVKDGMNDSQVASATYTIISGIEGYDIDFENDANVYTNWAFTNIVSNYSNDDIDAQEGSKYGSTDGKASGSIQTKEIVETPNTLTCYVSKQTNNNTASTWYIQVSSDGSTWEDVASTSATNMTKGEWKEFTADLSGYTDVYVRVYYSGSTAVRLIDNLTLTTTAPAVATPTFSPVGGEYTEAQTVTISCSTADATIYYTTDGTEPTNQSTPYSSAISVEETTTIKAIAYVGTDASQVATATYTIKAPQTLITIAEARDQETGDVYTAGVVTSKNGSTVYIQDETAAIVVYGSNSLAIGDAITVQGTLTTFNGLLEIGNPVITVTSEENEVTPEVMAIADISNDNQAKLIKIEGATVIAIDDKNVTIAQDENTIVVRFNNANDIKFEVEDVISLTGNIGCYNAPQIANPRDITVAGQMVSLPFYESFDTNDGKGGNDEEGWNGSIANNNIKYDNEGWEAKNVNGANQCAKAGSGSAGGSLTTPTLAFEAGKTYKLTFKAAAWDGNNEKTTLNISSTSGTLNKTSVEMEKGAWTEYTVYLTSATAAGTIKFSTSSANNRFFLDEVEIEESNVVPVTIGETGYATLYYSDKALDIPEDVRVSIVASVDKGSITLEELEQRTIPAGTGVVLQGVAGDYEFTVSDEDLDAPTNNMLKGSDEEAQTEGDGKFYQLSLNADGDEESIGFYWGAANGAAFTNGAHKAYLVVPAEKAAKSYIFNGLVTAIRGISTVAENAEIYTIGGVRVKADKLPKGIYIANGKKMVVK